MADVYSDDDCIEYQLTDISWEVITLEKTANNTYTVNVVVDCTSSDPELWSATEGILAFAVEKYVPGGYHDDVKSTTGAIITLRNENVESPYYGEYMLTVNVNGNNVHGPKVGEHSKSSSNTDPEDGFGHNKFDAIVIAEKTVKNNLKSPSTANFCSTSDYTISCSENEWTVSGYVDAQNSFGAELRSNFTVTFTFSSSENYTVNSCNIQ